MDRVSASAYVGMFDDDMADAGRLKLLKEWLRRMDGGDFLR